MDAILEFGKRYIVTKESDDGTFEVGDHIWLYPDGCVCCKEAAGWIDKADVPAAMAGVEIKVDKEWAEAKKRILREKLARLEAICP